MDLDSAIACIVLEQICKENAKITLNLGKVEDVSQRNFLVGRTPECDLYLVSTQYPLFISRQHARVTLNETQIFVTDLKSVNGTFVNDVMLQPMVKTKISIGDLVTFGCMSPEKEIVPGAIAQQDDPIFKFILKETRDRKLADQMEDKVRCAIKPWPGETKVLLVKLVPTLLCEALGTLGKREKESGCVSAPTRFACPGFFI